MLVLNIILSSEGIFRDSSLGIKESANLGAKKETKCHIKGTA
jgi:hypothetical protein